jgi:hypothetical protein
MRTSRTDARRIFWDASKKRGAARNIVSRKRLPWHRSHTSAISWRAIGDPIDKIALRVYKTRINGAGTMSVWAIFPMPLLFMNGGGNIFGGDWKIVNRSFRETAKVRNFWRLGPICFLSSQASYPAHETHRMRIPCICAATTYT